MAGRTEEGGRVDWQRLSDELTPTRVAAIALLGAIALLVAVRVWVPFERVFQGGDVVLAASEPHRYRSFVDQLLATQTNPFAPGELPAEIRADDVGFIATMWAAAVLLGGTSLAGGVVLAWYPVVAGVVTAGLVYLLAVWVARDRRVGILAVVVLALMPAHAYRTMLGVGDHDAFGYVAVLTTATALVWLLRADDDGRRWADRWYALAVFAAGIGMAAATFGWRGGPMLLAPVVVFALFLPVLCVKHGRSPLAASRGLLSALVVGALLGLGLHFGLGWAEPHRGFAPLFLLVLVAALVWIGEAIDRMEWPWPATLVPVPAVAGIWLVGLWSAHPAFAEPMQEFWEFAVVAGLSAERASVTANLDTAMLLFGLLLLVAIPVMLWVVAEFWDAHRPHWLLVAAYAWTFLALALLRFRWSGLAALFIAVFGAVGVLYLARWIEVVRPLSVFAAAPPGGMLDWDADELQRAGRGMVLVVLILLLVMGTGLAQIPGTMQTLTHDEATHETATAIAAFADEHALEGAERHVFTERERNRAINYVVSGDARSDAFAAARYRAFVSSSDPAGWDEQFDGEVGFVVVQDTPLVYPRDSMQVRLNDRLGSEGAGVEGLSRYRLVHVSQDGSTKAFAFVPGATITGTAEPDASVEVATNVTVAGESFGYTRTVETDADGSFAVTVPYPGEYVYGGGEIVVPEEAVMNGETVEAE